MNENMIVLLPLLLPVIAGIAVGFLNNEKIRNLTVFVVLVLEVLFVVYFAFGDFSLVAWQITDSLAISYRTDGVGKFFACLFATIWLLAGVYSFEYMKHEIKPKQFFVFYTMTLGALLSLCYASNLMTLYLSYEFMTLLTVPFVLHTGQPDAVRAGMKYLGYSIFGAGLGLLGFFFLNTYCTTTEFIAGGTLNMHFVTGREGMLLVVLFLMLIGFGCKAGLFPLQAWLPTAHPVAPSPASAVLSGVITKGGIICMIRVVYYLFGADFVRGTWVQTTILVLAMITVFMGSMLAYKERLLKRRLAYSTVSQVSYVIFGLLLLSPIGFMGALMQVVYHAIAKNILFFSAGAIIYKTEKKYVHQLRGIGKEMPIVMWCFTIAALSLVGIPPTAGFVSKWFLAQGGLQSPLTTMGVGILMVSALLTAGYLLSITIKGFFPGTDFAYAEVKSKEPNWLMTAPLVVLAAAIVLLGIFPNFLGDIISNISSVLF